jgi:ubiquinol-cytochrome c reductase cytochrome c subunit
MTGPRRPARRARVARLLVAVPVVAAALAGVAALPGSAAAGQDGAGGDPGAGDEGLIEAGRELYLTGCSSCHGPEGEGTVAADGSERGPSLLESGEAGAYYYLSTGRMPLADIEDQPTRKEPAYGPEEIDALVAYVGSLGDGPAIPEVDIEDGDLAAGGELFRANCQACHSASGSGGALSSGRAAPGLADATPTQVAAAVRVGPGQMPVFGPETLDDDDLNDLVRYVEYLDDPADPGGLPIGRTGPIPEGFVAWLVGMGALLALVAWIGTRSPARRERT